jgi:MFS family permease
MITATQLPMAFYIVCAVERFSLPSSAAGTFITVMMCGSLIFPFSVGWLADRYGHRVNLRINCLVILSCNLLALLARSPFLYALVFLLLPLRRGIDITSYTGISMEFCAPKDRPTYVAISNSFAGPFILFGLLGGWIRGRFGYTPLFLSSSIIAVAALFLLTFLMKDPRQIVSPKTGYHPTQD